ncbi:LPS assembly lipoprotein LptE [Archangium sp.]|uniref:LPS assembly lipoprotein LptE n=1 Tax=Archangium sp. TaxID=1872627 RepID=UPI002D6657EC|nr:LPS assembly lipoprotein LptE [Archangium sp.]HYO51599.1 LPS assembly lipoprotein LptE [Archangium sp.]
MSRMRVVGWVLVLSAAGCGYRFTPRGAGLPEGVRSVCAPVFRNDTPEPGLELLFTRTFRLELVRAGMLGGAGVCEALVEGVVEGVGSTPTVVTEPVYEGNTRVAEPQLASYRASATVLLRLMRDGRVLSETRVSGTEDFLPGTASVSGDVLEAEANRQAALHRLAETLMREGYDRLASSW